MSRQQLPNQNSKLVVHENRSERAMKNLAPWFAESAPGGHVRPVAKIDRFELRGVLNLVGGRKQADIRGNVIRGFVFVIMAARLIDDSAE